MPTENIAVIPTCRLDTFYISPKTDGTISSEDFNTLKNYINENGVDITLGEKPCKRIYLYANNAEIAAASASIAITLHKIDEANNQYHIEINSRNVDNTVDKYFVSTFLEESIAAYKWAKYDGPTQTWVEITNQQVINTGSTVPGVTEAHGGSTYYITQTQNEALKDYIYLVNTEYTLELYGTHITYTPNPTAITKYLPIEINITTDAGWHAEEGDFSNVYAAYDDPSNVRVLTLSNPTADASGRLQAVQDGPTPTDEENYCYVDRIKKFITRMEGKKISEGE